MKTNFNPREVKYNRIKEHDILTEIYHMPKKARDVIFVFCYGMPSHPFDRFPFGLEPYLREGIIVAYPHYKGTFGSGGICTIENSVDSVISSIDTLLNEELYDSFSTELIQIEPQEVVVVGSSFGGSIALVAGAKSNNIKNIIAIAAPTDYRTHGHVPGIEEYDLVKLEEEMKHGYKDEWLIDFSSWKKFISGELDINPIDYVEQLKPKNTFLIHGEKDLSVSVKRSIELNKRIKSGREKHWLHIVPDAGHINTSYIGTGKVYSLVESWRK